MTGCLRYFSAVRILDEIIVLFEVFFDGDRGVYRHVGLDIVCLQIYRSNIPIPINYVPVEVPERDAQERGVTLFRSLM